MVLKGSSNLLLFYLMVLGTHWAQWAIPSSTVLMHWPSDGGWHWGISEALRVCVLIKLLQSCPTLCDPMDCSLPGYSVHGILQARILEWVVMPSSRGSSQPRDQTCVS